MKCSTETQINVLETVLMFLANLLLLTWKTLQDRQ